MVSQKVARDAATARGRPNTRPSSLRASPISANLLSPFWTEAVDQALGSQSSHRLAIKRDLAASLLDLSAWSPKAGAAAAQRMGLIN